MPLEFTMNLSVNMYSTLSQGILKTNPQSRKCNPFKPFISLQRIIKENRDNEKKKDF